MQVDVLGATRFEQFTTGDKPFEPWLAEQASNVGMGHVAGDEAGARGVAAGFGGLDGA